MTGDYFLIYTLKKLKKKGACSMVFSRKENFEDETCLNVSIVWKSQ